MESEACAFALYSGGEEWVEDAVDDVRWDAGTVVGDRDGPLLGRLSFRMRSKPLYGFCSPHSATTRRNHLRSH